MPSSATAPTPACPCASCPPPRAVRGPSATELRKKIITTSASPTCFCVRTPGSSNPSGGCSTATHVCSPMPSLVSSGVSAWRGGAASFGAWRMRLPDRRRDLRPGGVHRVGQHRPHLRGLLRVAFHEDQRDGTERFVLAEKHAHRLAIGGQPRQVDQDGVRRVLADAAEPFRSQAQVGRRVKAQCAQSRCPFDGFRRVPVNHQDAGGHRPYARTTPVTGSRRLRI